MILGSNVSEASCTRVPTSRSSASRPGWCTQYSSRPELRRLFLSTKRSKRRSDSLTSCCTERKPLASLIKVGRSHAKTAPAPRQSMPTAARYRDSSRRRSRRGGRPSAGPSLASAPAATRSRAEDPSVRRRIRSQPAPAAGSTTMPPRGQKSMTSGRAMVRPEGMAVTSAKIRFAETPSKYCARQRTGSEEVGITKVRNPGRKGHLLPVLAARLFCRRDIDHRDRWQQLLHQRPEDEPQMQVSRGKPGRENHRRGKPDEGRVAQFAEEAGLGAAGQKEKKEGCADETFDPQDALLQAMGRIGAIKTAIEPDRTQSAAIHQPAQPGDAELHQSRIEPQAS